MERLLFYGSISAFALGIFIASFLDLSLPPLYFCALLGLSLVCIARKEGSLFARRLVMFIGICLCVCACGYVRMHVASQLQSVSQFADQVGDAIDVTGIVVSEPEQTATSKQFYFKTGNERLLVRTDPQTAVSYGEQVQIQGTLQAPDTFQTQGGRMFDYPGYLRAHGVSYIISFANITPTGVWKGNPIITVLFTTKHAFMANIEKVIPQPQAGLGEGLLLGVKQALGKDIEDAFRTVGVTHIVVLSGYNVMLVVTFVMYVLALVLPLRVRLIVGAVCVVLFACMVGFSATVVRASAMAILVLIAKATGRTYAVMRALMFTAVVMLFINPFLLVYDIGFQLSFVATLGLILVAPHVERRVGFMPTQLGLREFMTATISAQIMVTPILLYQMGQFSVVAVVVNLLVLPMVPLAMLLTWITGVVGAFSPTLALPMGYLAYLTLSYILAVVHVFSSIPFASIVVPTFPFSVVVLAYLLLSFAIWKLRFPSQTRSDLSNWTIIEEEQFAQELIVRPNRHKHPSSVFFG